MSMTTREQFEAWFENDVVDKKVTFPAFEDGEYTEGDLYDDQLYFMLQAMWMAWQAASKASEQQLAAVVAENAGLKSNLMFWDADNPELPYEHPDEIAMECEIAYDDTFEVQVAARMPNRKYRVVIMTDDDCQTEQVVSEEIQTPATDAFLVEVRAQGVDLVCDYHKSRCEALHDVDRNGSQRHGAALCDAIDIAAQLRQVGAV